ncbi:Disease resistance protein [Melia azedarach]|uniref:Disease resistance protein n=1 Tax=Melia azedarach TaxID=155640 RepID=A0ACC1YE33_MELAZ|nr:Disease resistance protein [Melia azedarach]
MAEITVTIAIEVVKFIATCIAPSAGRQIGYVREYKSNFEKLEAEAEKLKNKRTSILEGVDAAKKNVEEIKENVQKWLEGAEAIEKNVQGLLDRAGNKVLHSDSAAAAGRRTGETEEDTAGNVREDEQTAAGKRCFKALCPDLKTRYQLSKEAVTQLKDIVRHLEAGNFDKISHPIIPKDPRLSHADFEEFESRKYTLFDVISSLSDPDVNIVGIYGMGGIGKTMLAKQVANHPETIKLFDSVIFVEVTQNVDKMKIQKEVAENLGLTVSEEETQSTRARKLYQRLENEKRILIILDNIWAHLDLKEIGIPLADQHKGCKVLLTARSVEVLSTKMSSQRNFQVRFLDDEEAWTLFKKMAGEYIEGREFKSVATEVANKCAGLPIVIVTIARALANKELFVWENALQQLRVSSSENIQDIHASIELSYNHLETEALKKALLLIPFANLTFTDELLMYGMGVGLFDGIKEMEKRRARIQTLVQQLKDSCLLLDGKTTHDDFSMHDVVRDVVKSIAFRDRQAFANDLSEELEWSDEISNTFKACSSIVLKDVKPRVLPQVLESSQLKLLSISAADRTSLKVHDEFFTRLKELKVLILANMDLASMPLSLCFLTNLRALGLYKCKLNDIAIIGDLRKLEILSLTNSKIEQISVEVGSLTQLKSLDLYTYYRCIIPPNVISGLTHLEELYIRDFVQREAEGLENDGSDAILSEVKYLSNLTSLEIMIKDVKSLPKDLSFQKLKRYKIAITSQMDFVWEDYYSDRDWSWNFMKPESSRKLNLSHINTNICLKDGHIMQLKGIEDLYLQGSYDMKSVLYGLDRDGFQQLKYLQVRDNSNLSCIVESMEYTTHIAFPILETLLIRNLVNLEKICHGPLTAESSFCKLRKIIVKDCNKLENIFSLSIAKRLRLLQSINVNDCQNVKDIIAIERGDESGNYSELIDNVKFGELRSLKLSSLPQLRSFYFKLKTPCALQQRRDEIILEEDIDVSDTLFTKKVVLPNLEVLDLNTINVRMIWQNQEAALSSGVKNLTRLIISGCNNLRYLFSSSSASSFIQLQYFQISQCQALEEMVVTDESKDVLFPQLQDLVMGDLENLTKFFSGYYIGFPSLRKLSISSCPKLKEFMVKNTSADDSTENPLPFFNEMVALPKLEVLKLSECNSIRSLFSSSMIRSLVQLQDLKIYVCPILEVIFDLEGANFVDEVAISQLTVLHICTLPKLKHIWNKDPRKFLSFEKLNRLRILECDTLKNVFPVSIASNLSQLERVEIENCGVEEIVSVANGASETEHRFVFPRVISLTLRDLPKFTTFFPGIYTTEWPALKELIVTGWKILTSLGRKQESHGESEVQPRILVENLREDLICKLKWLDVYLDESIDDSSLDFLQRFHCIKELLIQGQFYALKTRDENEVSVLIKRS